MINFIIYSFVLLSFASHAFSMEMSSDLSKRLNQMLSKKEWDSFVPIVDDENVFTVNKVSENNFGKRVTGNSKTELFSIKGYLFNQNPAFPVELGDQLIISSEEKEMLAGGSYRVHLSLTSLKNNKTQEFTSHIVYKENSGIIERAVEKERVIGTGSHCTRWGHDYWDDSEICVGLGYHPMLNITYDLTLQDGSTYHLVFTLDKNGLTENDLSHISENFHLEEGDEIVFARYVDGNPSEMASLNSLVKIKGKDPEGSYCYAQGTRRLLENYNKNNVYLIKSQFNETSIRIANFGSLYQYYGLSNYRDHFATFYEPGKGPAPTAHWGRYIYSDIPMKLIGYFKKDSQRVFVFVDNSDNLLFAFPTYEGAIGK